jgi:hypothetical protein
LSEVRLERIYVSLYIVSWLLNLAIYDSKQKQISNKKMEL